MAGKCDAVRVRWHLGAQSITGAVRRHAYAYSCVAAEEEGASSSILHSMQSRARAAPPSHHPGNVLGTRRGVTHWRVHSALIYGTAYPLAQPMSPGLAQHWHRAVTGCVVCCWRPPARPPKNRRYVTHRLHAHAEPNEKEGAEQK